MSDDHNRTLGIGYARRRHSSQSEIHPDTKRMEWLAAAISPNGLGAKIVVGEAPVTPNAKREMFVISWDRRRGLPAIASGETLSEAIDEGMRIEPNPKG